jgi:hypothetical protein
MKRSRLPTAPDTIASQLDRRAFPKAHPLVLALPADNDWTVMIRYLGGAIEVTVSGRKDNGTLDAIEGLEDGRVRLWLE